MSGVLDDGSIRIDILRDDTFCLQILPAHGGLNAPQVAVIVTPEDYSPTFTCVDQQEYVSVKNSVLEIKVYKYPFRIEAFRAEGSVIFETPIKNGLGSYAQLNDASIVTRTRSADCEILGLGEKTGRSNRSGRKFTMWNVDVLNPAAKSELGQDAKEDGLRDEPTSTEYDPYYISIPFYQSLDGKGRAAGFFSDNLCRTHYDFSIPGESRMTLYGGRYVEYIFAGPTLEKVVEAYSELTGRITVPPLWALGYHHCRWHPYSQNDVLKHAQTYRKHRIPCDSIWLDIDHMDGYRVFTWNKKLMPEPAKMLTSLTEMGFRSVTIVDPGVKVDPGYSVYDSGLKTNAFCLTEGGAVYQGQVWPGKTAFSDFASAKARAWWGDLNAKHVQSGISGIWNDMNEPATGDIPASAMRFDGGKYSHGTYHNAYAMLMAMGTVEGLRKAMPDRRTFVLSRAGSAGIQRYAANWLGDNMSRWEHLAMSIPMSLGLGLSGQPFVGADIGGFGESSNGELLVRWTQLATLTPFCRNHNDAGNVDQCPWSFGKKTEAHCKAAIDLRYRLMPYLYSTFVDSAETGMPIMRHLALESPSDLQLREIDDQYLLGASILVAPIVAPGVTARSVTLPKGNWYDWYTGETCSGTVWTQAPLSKIPIFVREGSVLPLWPEAPPSTMHYHPETVELHVFVPELDGEYVSSLVEDDGESFGFQRDERVKTTFIVTRKGRTISISASCFGETYPGFNRKSFTIILIGAKKRIVDSVPCQGEGFEWSRQI
jgi:alpha-glucosidase